MQLFTHLLSSYLQGMGDFFSALPREGWGGASEGMAGCVDRIIILPFFATKSTKNIVFVSDFIIFL